MSSRKIIQTEVLIVGGGLVGGLLGARLQQKNIPFVLIDPTSPQLMIDAVKDGRTTAISLGSKRIFEKTGIWDSYLKDYAEPINMIRVIEKGSVWSVDFDHKELCSDPMGYIAENMYFRMSILDKLQDDPYCFYNTSLSDIKKNDHHITAVLSNGKTVHAKLLVSAEGKKSPTRNLMAPQIKTRDYAQNALVVHLEHEEPHHNHAWEIFTPQGPFAILPLRHHEGKKSGIVWCKPAYHHWESQTNDDLQKEIEETFPYYGKVKIVSKRWCFPLSTFELNTIRGHRQVLIGDAAHAMHPIAGQGVNLGWRDADVLATKIIENYTLGLDVGSEILCKAYERERMRDIKPLVKATDLITQLFSNNSKTLYVLRNAGFAVVNRVPPLKRFFMKQAMGLS
jgi:2-octaprenyl-6-methoxyphenol hydroxylase